MPDVADHAGAAGIQRVKLADLEGATDKPVRPGVCVRWRGALWSCTATGHGWADLQLIGH